MAKLFKNALSKSVVEITFRIINKVQRTIISDAHSVVHTRRLPGAYRAFVRGLVRP